MDDEKEAARRASREYYSHQAYYEDLMVQRRRHVPKELKLELDFLEFAFRTHATRPVKEVLDVACGNGPHVVGLAHRGYRCTGMDFTPERVEMAKVRAEREGVSVKLMQGDATRLGYENEFDAVLALYILFLLPSDEDVVKCLRQVHRALRPGGVLVCNVGNPFSEHPGWWSLKTIYQGYFFQNTRLRDLTYMSLSEIKDFDPVHGVVWWQETEIRKTPDGVRVFPDRERLRLFTYWDMLHYLEKAGFKEIKCYEDWKTKSPRKSKAQHLVFVCRKG